MIRIILILSLLLLPHTAMAQKNEMMEVKVYFLDEEVLSNRDCRTVKAVTRTIPKNKAIAKVALDELAKGPTKKEVKKYGVASNFPSKSIIMKSVKTKNNIAYVSFDEALLDNTIVNHI